MNALDSKNFTYSIFFILILVILNLLITIVSVQMIITSGILGIVIFLIFIKIRKRNLSLKNEDLFEEQ